MAEASLRVAIGVGLVLGPANALAAAADAPPAATPSPPSYPPPPPRVDGEPPPFDYPFAPAVVAVAPAPLRDYRGPSLTLGLGPSGLFGPGEQALALSYLPLRFGWGFSEKLMVLLGFEGVGTNSVNPKTKQDSWLYQDVWSLALQARLPSLAYVRGGMGLASVGEVTTSGESFSGGHGMAVLGAIGREIYGGEAMALALELNGSYTSYRRESWKTIGVQVTVSIFPGAL